MKAKVLSDTSFFPSTDPCYTCVLDFHGFVVLLLLSVCFAGNLMSSLFSMGGEDEEEDEEEEEGAVSGVTAAGVSYGPDDLD